MKIDKDTIKELKDLRDEFAKVNTDLSKASTAALNHVIYSGEEFEEITVNTLLEHARKLSVEDKVKEGKIIKVINKLFPAK